MSGIDWDSLMAKLPTEQTPESKARRSELFATLDPNANGWISAQELGAGLSRLFSDVGDVLDVRPVVSRAFAAAKRRQEARGATQPGADGIDQRGFRVALLFVHQYFDYWRMFDAVDFNNDKAISLAEFEMALPVMERWGLVVDDVPAAFAEVDTNGGGRVVFSEFCEWCIAKSLELGDTDDESGDHAAASAAAPSERASTPPPPPPAAVAEEPAVAAAEEPDAQVVEEVAVEHEGAQDAAPEAETLEVHEQQEQGQPPIVEAETARADVVAEWNGHYFSQADVNDVIKIQAVYRRQEAQRRAKERREEREARIRLARAAPIEPIVMPEMPAADGSDEAAATAAAGRGASGAQHGALGNVDFSRVTINTMSADTKGMQKMYTRMLKSKMWW